MIVHQSCLYACLSPYHVLGHNFSASDWIVIELCIFVPHIKAMSHAKIETLGPKKSADDFLSKLLLAHNFGVNGWIWIKLGLVVPITKTMCLCKNRGQSHCAYFTVRGSVHLGH